MRPTDARHDGPAWNRLTYMMLAPSHTGCPATPLMPKPKAVKQKAAMPKEVKKPKAKPISKAAKGPPKKYALKRVRATPAVKPRKKQKRPSNSIAVIVRYPDKGQKRFASVLGAAAAVGLRANNVGRGLDKRGFYESRQGHVIVKE